jgi:holo-[acyl-carrier protein] synthase
VTGPIDPLQPDPVLGLTGDPLQVRGAHLGAAAAASMVTGLTGVLGVGIDVVAVDRFAAALQRTPALAHRLFTGPERITVTGSNRSAASLAARFAVKEAVAKALGVPAGMDWHDCTVVSEASGRPTLAVTGTVADACAALGIRDWRISLSHDAGIAAAVVIGLG